jgi:hypothetical protein
VLKGHLANVCFRGMLQVFRIGVAKVDRDVAKVDQNVAHVAMAMHICFKCMFQMFRLYQTYVASVFFWMLHIYMPVTSVYLKCFRCTFSISFVLGSYGLFFLLYSYYCPCFIEFWSVGI